MQTILEEQVARNILIRAGKLSGDSFGLRTGLLGAGGAQAGIFSAGGLHQMHDMGLYDKLDYVVAVSANAPNCAFYLSGSGPVGFPIYWDDNCKRFGFINPFRIWKMVDVSNVEETMRTRKVLDVRGIKNNPTRFFVTLTNITGQGELFDVKSSSDVIVPVMASCELPIYSNRARLIKGKRYLDGAISLPLPVSLIAKQFHLTDLLVIINQPNEPEIEERPIFEKIAARCLLRPYSRGLEKAFLERKIKFNLGLQEANVGIVDNGTSDGCRVAVVSPNHTISGYCTKPEVLKAFALEGRKEMEQFFSGATVSHSV